MNKKILGVLILALVSVVSFADTYEVNDCVKVSKAIATNVAIASSHLGSAAAKATSVAQTPNVKVVAQSIAKVANTANGIAVAIANSVAVEVSLCPYMERALSSLGISLQKTIGMANQVAIAGSANDKNTWNALKGSLNNSASKIKASLNLLKPIKNKKKAKKAKTRLSKKSKKKKAEKASKKRNKKNKKKNRSIWDF